MASNLSPSVFITCFLQCLVLQSGYGELGTFFMRTCSLGLSELVNYVVSNYLNNEDCIHNNEDCIQLLLDFSNIDATIENREESIFVASSHSQAHGELCKEGNAASVMEEFDTYSLEMKVDSFYSPSLLI